MKIQAIELENYGPFYGKHRFELSDRGLITVLGENLDEPRMNSNGSGKSSLTDALDWGLFGVHPRGDSADTVINDEAAAEGRGAKVTIYTEDAESSLRIERRRQYEGESGVRLFCDGEDVSAFDSRETESYIVWHLGVDRQVFHSTVLFAQNDLFKFADATDAKRVEILTKILRLELIDQWLADAKATCRDADAQAQTVLQDKAAIDGQIEALRGIDDSGAEASYEQQRHQRAARLASEQKEVLTQLQEATERIAQATEVEAQIAAHSAAKPQPSATYAQACADARSAQGGLAQAREYLGRMQAEAAAATKKMNLLIQGQCPTCEQPIGMNLQAAAYKVEDAAHINVRDAQAIVQQWVDYVANIETVVRTEDATYRKESEVYQRQAGELSAMQRALRQAQNDATHLRHRLEKLKLDEQANATAPNPAVQDRALRQGKIQALHARSETWHQKITEIASEVGRIKFWIDAFGPKGLKSYILDARLAEMTEAANHWVKILTGGTYWIRLETQSALKSGALRNRFNIRVFSGRGSHITERNYQAWSGGQKQRISLAIDFGLSRLIAKRAAKSYDLLILDEIFKHLDAKGRDAVMEMLQNLRTEKSTILVVDHDAEFQAMFEQSVIIRMQDGRASICEGETHVRHPEPRVQAAASTGEGDPLPPGAAGGEDGRGDESKKPRRRRASGGARPRRTPVRERAGKDQH